MSLVHGSNDSKRQCPSIVSDQDTFAKATLNSSPSTRPKVLGIQWDPVADTLVMDLAAVLEKSPMETVTKRDVLAATAKMYDPLGLLCPVIVRLKIFFQELCRCKRDWDDPLQEQHLTKWKQMVGEMKTMEPCPCRGGTLVITNSVAVSQCMAFATHPTRLTQLWSTLCGMTKCSLLQPRVVSRLSLSRAFHVLSFCLP